MKNPNSKFKTHQKYSSHKYSQKQKVFKIVHNLKKIQLLFHFVILFIGWSVSVEDYEFIN